jgi:hypothetical protein
LTEGEVSIPLDAIEKLVVKRAVRAWISQQPLGEWTDKEEAVEAGTNKMYEAGVAITLTASQTKPHPVAIVGTAWTVSYWCGEWVGGWEEATFPEQEYVYTYRPPKLDPFNTPMNSGGDPNNPIFDPKTVVGIFGLTALGIDQLREWDEKLKKAKNQNVAQPSTTNVHIPIPTTVGPN